MGTKSVMAILAILVVSLWCGHWLHHDYLHAQNHANPVTNSPYYLPQSNDEDEVTVMTYTLHKEFEPKSTQTLKIMTFKKNGPVNMLVIEENGKVKFTLARDGSITVAKDFKIDDTATIFWKAMSEEYPKICEIDPQKWKAIQ